MKSYFYIVSVLSLIAACFIVWFWYLPKPPQQHLNKHLIFLKPTITDVSPPPVKKPETRQLCEFITQFKTQTQDARVHNIELGAKKLDGIIINPGDTFSFNQTIGPRDEEHDFKNAPALFLGETIQELGGGMCQVSSTLHAAALNVGLEIIERHPHSRPSSYIVKGFDATVNYPPDCQKDKPDLRVCFDLKIRNPYDFPITINTTTFDSIEPPDKIEVVPKKSLKVVLSGIGPVAQIKTAWKTYTTPPFKQKFRKHPWRKTGKWIKQSGMNGVEGVLVIDATWPDGKTNHKTVLSKYDPVNEIWEVGQDWDMDKNPWEN